jgi:hypothetical protein
MAKQEKNPLRLLTPQNGFPRGRLIWARLFEAEAMEEGNEPSYSCAILFKEDTNLKSVRKAIQASIDDMNTWKGKLPRKGQVCLMEGDEIDDIVAEEKYPYIETGDVILKLRRYEKYGPPQLWDQKVEPIESPSEMYSGCHVLGDVEFFAWERKTSSGVSCRLNGLQKVREDEPLGGGKANTEDSFSKVETDDDDDDDDDDDRPKRGKKPARSRKPKDDDDDLL